MDIVICFTGRRAIMDHGVEDGDEEGVSLGEHGAELTGPGVAIAAGDRP